MGFYPSAMWFVYPIFHGQGRVIWLSSYLIRFNGASRTVQGVIGLYLYFVRGTSHVFAFQSTSYNRRAIRRSGRFIFIVRLVYGVRGGVFLKVYGVSHVNDFYHFS